MNGRSRAAAATAVLAVALSACAGRHSATDAAAKDVVDADSTTVCATAAKPVALPPAFPAGFPLPTGTVVTAVSDRGEAGLVITGVTTTAFPDVLAALQRDLPRKGYTLEDGETEPHDAESDWRSSGYEGRWAIREIPQCPGDTAVSVVARRT